MNFALDFEAFLVSYLLYMVKNHLFLIWAKECSVSLW